MRERKDEPNALSLCSHALSMQQLLTWQEALVAFAMFFLLALCPSHANDIPTKPSIVIFDLHNIESQGRLGHWASLKLRASISREKSFILTDSSIVEKTVSSRNFHPQSATEPAQVVGFAKEHFDADIAMWGRIHRASDRSIFAHIRVAELKNDMVLLKLDHTFVAVDRSDFRAVADKVTSLISNHQQPVPSKSKVKMNWKYRTNLVKNGNFESGHGNPSGWHVSVENMAWTKSPAHGRIVTICVIDSTEEKVGPSLSSDFFGIDETAIYRCSVDAKSNGPKVTVVIEGYALRPKAEEMKEAEWKVAYRCELKPDISADWNTFAFDFRPLGRLDCVKKAIVELRLSGPLGEACFDNVIVKRVYP